MYKYVDEQAIVRESEDPQVMVKTDACYMSPDGIVEVSTKRWEEAQRYEHREWMINGLNAVDDRNSIHADHFDSYKSITKRDFKNIIELGCGPFTNMRLIYEKLRLSNLTDVTLLDPLADEYKKHPNCQYNGYWSRWNPPTIVNSSIESFEVKEQYDMVVMINVLEHCMSIPAIFDQILAMTAPGGHFVFSDVYFEESVVEDMARHVFNAGHPIRITDKYLFDFLHGNFNGIYEIHKPEMVAGRQANEIYFIGTKQ